MFENTAAMSFRANWCGFGYFSRLSSFPLHFLFSTLEYSDETTSLIHWYVPTEKPFLLLVNGFKQCSESWTRDCFCSTLTKISIHLEKSYFIPKFSWIVLNRVPFDNYRMSDICCNFIFSASILDDNKVGVSFRLFRLFIYTEI